MANNPFESSRISEGTLAPAGQRVTSQVPADRESDAISRDDARDGFDIPRSRRVLAASTLTGDRVTNPAGETLGAIEEIMIDAQTGHIAYAVLSFGGFLGIGDKLFAVPWKAMKLDRDEHQFILDISRSDLENAPGFDKDNWPDMADPAFATEVHEHYREQPYWEPQLTAAGDYRGDNPTPDRSSEYDTTTGYAPVNRK